MSPERHVLDTSALLTFIEDEPGAGIVEKLLRSGNSIIPWAALLEIHYITNREKGPEEADRRFAILKQANAEIVWTMDEATLLTAARFKASHSLSFADAIIAATAWRREGVLTHKDPEFEALSGFIAMQTLPYK